MVSISTILDAKCKGNLSLKYMIAAYDFYERVVEKFFGRMNAMIVHVSCENGVLNMKIQLGSTSAITDSELDGLGLCYGRFSYNVQEEDVIIDFAISKGGVCE